MSDEVYQEGIDAGLPAWVLNAISSIAWDRGHAYGQNEVDLIGRDMIYTFKRQYENKDNPDFQRRM